MAKSLIDYILPEDIDTYKAIIERAAETKANTPKEKKPRAPMTIEKKIAADEKKLAKLQEKLAAMRATIENE